MSFFALMLPLALAVRAVPLVARLALALAGVGLALVLPGDAARYALLAGLGAAGVALLAPVVVSRVAAGALAGFILVAPLLIGAVTARAPDLSGLPFSAVHRVLIWDFVTDRIAERPLLGWGMESSRAIPEGARRFAPETLIRFGLDSAEEQRWFTMPAAQRLPLHPHNASLHIWLELGVVGAALAAALAASLLLASGTGTLAAGVVGVVASASVTGLLSFGVWQPWWVAALMLCTVSVAALRRQER